MANKKPVSNVLVKAGDYSGLLSSVSELLEQARRTSARTVNAVLSATYWEIGRRIVEFEQAGEKRAEYGEALLHRLASDLTVRFGRGFSERNLGKYRLFYLIDLEDSAYGVGRFVYGRDFADSVGEIWNSTDSV